MCDAVLQRQRRPLEAFLPRDPPPGAIRAHGPAPTTRAPRPRWPHRRGSSRGRAVEHAGVWVKDAVREPSLTGGPCGRTGATGAWRGAPDRRGGRLPPRSGARGGTRRAHRPSRSDRGHLAPVHGPWACAGNTGPLLHAVRPLQGTTRRAAAAPKHTRTTAGRGGGPRGLGGLRRVRPRARYPQTATTRERAQAGPRRSQSPPPTGRRVVYTTNAIESLNYQLRKVTKNRGHYSPPTRPQLNYCGWRSATSRTNAPKSATRTRANPPANAPPHPASSKANSPPTAKQALAQLTTAYPDRITPYL